MIPARVSDVKKRMPSQRGWRDASKIRPSRRADMTFLHSRFGRMSILLLYDARGLRHFLSHHAPFFHSFPLPPRACNGPYEQNYEISLIIGH